MMPAEKGLCLLKTVLESDVNNTGEETDALWFYYLLELKLHKCNAKVE